MPIPPIPSDVHELLAGPWRAWVLPYGARLVQIWHQSTPLLLGFKDSSSYRGDRMSMGAVCGRYGNRIENARLERDGVEVAASAYFYAGYDSPFRPIGRHNEVWLKPEEE